MGIGLEVVVIIRKVGEGGGVLDVGFDFLGSGVDEKDVRNERFEYPFLFAVKYLMSVVLGKVGFRAVLGKVFVGFENPGVCRAKDEPLFRRVGRISHRHPCW